MARVSPTFFRFVALPIASIGCRELCAARRWPAEASPPGERRGPTRPSVTEPGSAGGLVRHPGGLEGFGPAGHVFDPDHRSSAEGGDLVVHLGLDLDPTADAAPVVAKPDRHAVAGVHELLRVESQRRERLVEPLPEADHLVRTYARVRPLVRGEHPLDLPVEVRNGRVEIAPVVGLDEVPRLLDVLLRHAPRSIALASLASRAGGGRAGGQACCRLTYPRPPARSSGPTRDRR